MISDAYYADTNKPWQRYMPFIEDMMKSVSLQVKIDGNILGVLGTFLLFSAMCYFINKDGQDYKINNSD